MTFYGRKVWATFADNSWVNHDIRDDAKAIAVYDAARQGDKAALATIRDAMAKQAGKAVTQLSFETIGDRSQNAVWHCASNGTFARG